MAQRLNAAEISEYLNKHMAMKMFVVGKSITVADIVLIAVVGPHFSKLEDREKTELPNVFRWVDHI